MLTLCETDFKAAKIKMLQKASMNILETNAKIGRPSRVKEAMEMKQMEILKLKHTVVKIFMLLFLNSINGVNSRIGE